MGRKKFNSFNKETKKRISGKIIARINEITKLKKSYSENLDIFEAVNDEMKDLFECDLDCGTCGTDDKGKCMQNFRMANIFFQRQCLILVNTINTYLETFENILNGLGYEILEEMKPIVDKKTGDKNYYS